jgi:hypothetical protein
MDRKQIMREMIDAVSKKYNVESDGFSWALLMSTTKVDKKRDGGILINQQALKKGVGAKEPDGTAIFVKVDKSMTPEKIKEISKSNFGKNWILFFDKDFYESEDNVVDFLTFDTNVNGGCLDENGFLIDRLFIDHTPVQISFNAIKQMINQPTLQATWKNLVVLNAGSITCSTKNWNLDIIGNMTFIEQIDRQLFDDMQKILYPDENDPSKSYDTIGKEYGNWKITNDTAYVIAKCLARAHVALIPYVTKKPIPRQRPLPRQVTQRKGPIVQLLKNNQPIKESLTKINNSMINKGTVIGGKYTKKGKHKTIRK